MSLNHHEHTLTECINRLKSVIKTKSQIIVQYCSINTQHNLEIMYTVLCVQHNKAQSKLIWILNLPPFPSVCLARYY